MFILLGIAILSQLHIIGPTAVVLGTTAAVVDDVPQHETEAL